MARLFTTNIHTMMSVWKLVNQLFIEIPLFSDTRDTVVNHTGSLSSRILCFYQDTQTVTNDEWDKRKVPIWDYIISSSNLFCRSGKEHFKLRLCGGGRGEFCQRK